MTEAQRVVDGGGPRTIRFHDPRATIIKKACDDVFEVTGVNPLLGIAKELEKIALEDEYFVKHPALRDRPYAGLAGQWLELVKGKEQRIARPKQIYTGPRTLDFVLAEDRWA